MINKNTIYTFSFSIAWQVQPTEGFVYILNKKNNTFLSFDGISKDIWFLIKDRKTINEISEQIALEYDADQCTITEDVCEFIESLVMEGVIIEHVTE